MSLTRRLANDEDVAKFQTSQTHDEVLNYVLALNSSCKGRKLGYVEPVSTGVALIRSALAEVKKLAESIETQATASRFGKPEFRTFCDELAVQSPAIISTSSEVCEYFSKSFGNRTRIDYGSGHELNFVCFLVCLQKLNVITASDNENISLGVFNDYLEVMRFIQQKFWLEPAGSHGVWGLDDYHFLPFMFGSAQLIGDQYVRPMSIHDIDVVDMYKETNYYFKCIYFINKVKKTSLRWHSPMLDDISGVKKWEKVNEGLVKMYKAEVLGKLPVIQHFLFGKLLPAPANVSESVGEEVHIRCWADCCGIRVPSAIAVDQATQGHTLKKLDAVPVD